MRVKHSFLILTAAGLLAPTFLWSQPGGGRFGGGGGGSRFDPSQFFDRMAKGKDSISRSDLNGFEQQMFDRWAQQLNITNGQMTRDQFNQVMQSVSRRRSEGGGGPPSFGPRPEGGSSSSGPRPEGGGGPTGGGRDERDRRDDRGNRDERDRRDDRGGRDERGGRDDRGGGDTDRFAEFMFRRTDRNSDGMLGFDEMSERLQGERDKWDANKDGFIDANEFRGYFAAARAEREGGNGGRSDSGGPGSPPTNNATPDPVVVPTTPQARPEEERRPTVMRAGNLPKELPRWFMELDTDEDGQVGLYEWRRGGRNLDDFGAYDFNADGLMTPEECLRQVKAQSEEGNRDRSAAVSAENGNGRSESRFGGDARNGGGRPTFGGNGGGRFGSGNGGGRPTFGDRGQGDGNRPAFGGNGNGNGGRMFGRNGNGDSGGQRPRFGGPGGGGPSRLGAPGGGGPPAFGGPGGGFPGFGGPRRPPGGNDSGQSNNQAGGTGRRPR